MSILDKIEKINNNIENAYSACSAKGATLPSVQNSTNLADCICSISTSGGGGGDFATLKNKIKKAKGWTNNSVGKCYIRNKNVDGTFDVLGPMNFTSLVKNYSTNYSAGFSVYILDNKMYYRNTSTYSGELNTLRQVGTISDWIAYTSTGTTGYAIRSDNSLYYFGASSYSSSDTITLIESGHVWSKFASYYSSGTYGIRDGQLAKIDSSRNITIIDSATWTDICCLSYGVSGYGIRNGQLCSVNVNTGAYTVLNSDTNWTAVTGSSYALGIKGGSLYYITGSNVRLIDDTQTWVKIAGDGNAITSTGKLYYYSSSYSTLTQIGTDTTWTDICGQSASGAIGLNNGNVYENLVPNSIKQLTFDGSIIQIDGQVSTMDDIYRTCAVFVSNTNSSPNIYTIDKYGVDCNLYSDTNTTKSLLKVYSVTDSAIQFYPKMNGVRPEYQRNSTIDTQFTVTPEEYQRTQEVIDELEGV